MAKQWDVPIENHVADKIRHLTTRLKTIAKHCEMANPVCPMLKHVLDANIELEDILNSKDSSQTNKSTIKPEPWEGW